MAETTLELFSTDAKGPIKILTEWSELELVPDLFVCHFVSDSFIFLGLSVIKHDEDRSNNRSLQLDYQANEWIWTLDCMPRDRKACATCDYSLG